MVEASIVLETTLKTIHLSCASHRTHIYNEGNWNYAGFILYTHNGQTEWWSLSRRKSKIGYLVIQDANSLEVKRHLNNDEGIHVADYTNVFREHVGNITGETFSIDREFRWHFNTFTIYTTREDRYTYLPLYKRV